MSVKGDLIILRDLIIKQQELMSVSHKEIVRLSTKAIKTASMFVIEDPSIPSTAAYYFSGLQARLNAEEEISQKTASEMLISAINKLFDPDPKKKKEVNSNG